MKCLSHFLLVDHEYIRLMILNFFVKFIPETFYQINISSNDFGPLFCSRVLLIQISLPPRPFGKLISKNRSSRSQMFCKIGVLKIFAIFTGKYLCWSLFLTKLQAWRPAILLKRNSNLGVCLWILQKNFKNSFLWNTSSGCFCKNQDH